ncbi:MAG: M28 family metallopeptidase [Terriglobia bacterium]
MIPRHRIARITANLACALCLASLIAAAGSKTSPLAISLHIQHVPLQIIEQRLKSAPRSNPQREVTLRKMFLAAGCPAARLTEEPVDPGQPPNLICTMPGKESSLIIVGGHLDKVRRGDGIVDDWSGSSMLPSLYTSLHATPRRHTFLFIAFTEEEKGLVGSKFYVRHLSRGFIQRIRAMVNLECLGMNPAEVWEDHAARPLLASLYRVSHSMGIIIPDVDLEGVGRDDAMSFRHRKAPTITIHSLTQDTVRVLHSKRDNISAEHMNDYYQSYRLVAAYLAYLDRTLP